MLLHPWFLPTFFLKHWFFCVARSWLNSFFHSKQMLKVIAFCQDSVNMFIKFIPEILFYAFCKSFFFLVLFILFAIQCLCASVKMKVDVTTDLLGSIAMDITLAFISCSQLKLLDWSPVFNTFHFLFSTLHLCCLFSYKTFIMIINLSMPHFLVPFQFSWWLGHSCLPVKYASYSVIYYINNSIFCTSIIYITSSNCAQIILAVLMPYIL